MGYPHGSFASTQVFFQSLMNKETIYYVFGIDFKTSDQIFSEYKITNLSCTPTFLSMLLINLKKEYPSVLKITTGGEKMKNSLINSFKKIFSSAEYINIYASTETGSLLYSTTPLSKVLACQMLIVSHSPMASTTITAALSKGLVAKPAAA